MNKFFGIVHNSKAKLFFGIFLALIFLTVSSPVFAEGLPYWGKDLIPCGWKDNECVNWCQLIKLTDNLTSFGITIAVFVIAPIFIAYGGIMIIAAGGSEARFSRGKQIVTAAVIGFLLALGAWLIITTFFGIIAGGSSDQWANIQCTV